jgi:hypothetical protein
MAQTFYSLKLSGTIPQAHALRPHLAEYAGYPVQQSRGDQMKKTYEGLARFVRWVVAGIISFFVALPAVSLLSTSS